MLHTADTDPELHNWLSDKSGSSGDFLHTLVHAAMTATPTEYSLLRPVLVSLRAQHPEPMSSVVTLIADDYRVTFSQTENVDAMTCAFNRFKSIAFDNRLPETAIRWASSMEASHLD